MSEIKEVDGFSVNGNDDNWAVECPQCTKRYEYEGFFDSSDKTECKCGCTFVTSRVWLNDREYII